MKENVMREFFQHPTCKVSPCMPDARFTTKHPACPVGCRYIIGMTGLFNNIRNVMLKIFKHPTCLVNAMQSRMQSCTPCIRLVWWDAETNSA